MTPTTTAESIQTQILLRVAGRTIECPSAEAAMSEAKCWEKHGASVTVVEVKLLYSTKGEG